MGSVAGIIASNVSKRPLAVKLFLQDPGHFITHTSLQEKIPSSVTIYINVSYMITQSIRKRSSLPVSVARRLFAV
jgi:hypothetical protein